jgi:CspA family cold shock protein
MNYRDTLIECEQCGREFVFTVEKQRQLAEQGREVSAPSLCESCSQKTQYGGKLHGRIKWFSLEKGYGFLIQEDASELFVHRSGLPTNPDGTPLVLEEGQEVLYEVLDTPKGQQAVQITPYAGR